MFLVIHQAAWSIIVPVSVACSRAMCFSRVASVELIYQVATLTYTLNAPATPIVIQKYGEERDDEVVVIDFKFGQPRPSHQRQVYGYMQLLAAMGYPTHSMKGYLWYVDAERIETVHFTPQPLG